MNPMEMIKPHKTTLNYTIKTTQLTAHNKFWPLITFVNYSGLVGERAIYNGIQ